MGRIQPVDPNRFALGEPDPVSPTKQTRLRLTESTQPTQQQTEQTHSRAHSGLIWAIFEAVFSQLAIPLFQDLIGDFQLSGVDISRGILKELGIWACITHPSGDS